MSKYNRKHNRNYWNISARSCLLAAGAILFSLTAANAGECPKGKVGIDVTKPGPDKPKGVVDKVISSIDLSSKTGLDNHLLRMRHLVIQPGGIVPWHNHGERPANIYVISGQITEYRSTCAVPITHKAGDAIPEFGANLSHWWRNNTSKPAVLISADLFNNTKKSDEHAM